MLSIASIGKLVNTHHSPPRQAYIADLQHQQYTYILRKQLANMSFDEILGLSWYFILFFK